MRNFLRHPVFFAAIVFLSALSCLAGRADVNAPQAKNMDSQLPSAEDILMKARMRIPGEPLLIKGRLLTGKRLGTLEKAFYLEAVLKLGSKPVSAQYTLRDIFGTPIKRLTIVRRPNEAPEFHYETGHPLQPTSTPDLHCAIEGTNITWSDLSLSFLWWQSGTTIGSEKCRGRSCVILEFTSEDRNLSEESHGPGSKTGTCPTVRLWIDEKLFMLIQMEEYDAHAKRQRRLSVKKLKKIDDLWMVKEMEIRSYPSKHRTVLRIDDITRLSGNGK